MLAYVDCVCVEYGGMLIAPDCRVRCNPRQHRVLTPSRNYGGWSDEYGSRLRDGSRLAGHDDWHCVQDLVAGGLIECVCRPIPAKVRSQMVVSKDAKSARRELNVGLKHGGYTTAKDDPQPGKIMHLTPLGTEIVGRLRAHKSAGGNFADFDPEVV